MLTSSKVTKMRRKHHGICDRHCLLCSICWCETLVINPSFLKGNNMTREEKILALTNYELVFLIESPEQLKDVSEFFAKGGFNAWTDEQLDTSMYHKFGDD